MPSRLALAIIAVAAALVPATHARAAEWKYFEAPDAPYHDDWPGKVAFDADGNGVAVWQRGGEDSTFDIVASTIAFGDDEWSTPQTISTSEEDIWNGRPSLAISPSGDVLVVWSHPLAENQRGDLQFSERLAGSTTWSPPASIPGTGQISSSPEYGSDSPQVVYDNDDSALLVFSYDTSASDSLIRTLRRATPGGSWADQHDLTTTADAVWPDVATTGDGDVAVSWREGQHNKLTTATGGVWDTDPPATISTIATNYSDETDVALAPNGKVAVTWSQEINVQGDRAAFTAVQRPSDSAPVITQLPAYAWPSIGADDDGMFTLAYQDGNVVKGARMTPTAATFGPGTALSDDNGTVGSPRLSVDPFGETTVVWRDSVGGAGRWRAAYYEDGAWSDQDIAHARTSGGYSTDPAVTHDSNGNVVIAFPDQGAAGALNNAMSFAIYDRTAPFLDDVVVPPNAIDGAEVELSAVASEDDWGTSGVRWTFVDGDVFGSPIERSFEGAGTHPVSVVAIDDAGNASESDDYGVVVQSTGGGHHDPGDGHHDPGTGGTGTHVTPAPPLPPSHPLAPVVNAVNNAAAMIQQVLGKAGVPYARMLLSTVQVFTGGEIVNGQLILPKSGGSFGLFGFFATQDTTITSTMSLTGLPGAKGKKASAAATRTVKLPKRTLKLKKGQAGAVKLRITAAQRKLIKKAKGKARLVVTITEQPTGGKAKKKTTRLKVK